MNQDIQRRLDGIAVSLAMRGHLDEGAYLKPALWEELRTQLQAIYRRATGENLAVLSVENSPAIEEA